MLVKKIGLGIRLNIDFEIDERNVKSLASQL